MCIYTLVSSFAELEEHHKCAVYVKEENSSGSSSDSEVLGFFAIGTKSKYGKQGIGLNVTCDFVAYISMSIFILMFFSSVKPEKYIEQCKDVLIANDQNACGSFSHIRSVAMQHVGAERKYGTVYVQMYTASCIL